MLGHLAASAYRQVRNACGGSQWEAVGYESHCKAVADKLAVHVGGADSLAFSRRRARNQLRSALWALNAVPWIPELTLDHLEWDVAWRLSFGGVTPAMRDRLDRPAEGFAFRGRRMEYAVMEAVESCLPGGTVRVWPQPSPERIPLDHAERCARDHVTPDGWRRADIALEFATGKTITLDVRTTNILSASAMSAGAPESHLHALERGKAAKYGAYYRDFKPFVLDLSGAVTETTFGALKSIAKEASNAARSVNDL